MPIRSSSRPAGSNATTPSSNLSSSCNSPSSRRDREWVPLFVSPSPDSPLVTATVLPTPSPRKQIFGELMPTAPVTMMRRDSSLMEYHDASSSLTSSPSRRSSTTATMGMNEVLPMSWQGLDPGFRDEFGDESDDEFGARDRGLANVGRIVVAASQGERIVRSR
ncbi:BQ2448_7466 [Microbotryum intermedium]|uniref:BQ2448_7466 protein n=1 Tax=Microbotryum intermedium TaxID=269621 RepID=A0A238FIC7_9BASI|nr:BQ2448_7466 [Microbotryum intermedium]